MREQKNQGGGGWPRREIILPRLGGVTWTLKSGLGMRDGPRSRRYPIKVTIRFKVRGNERFVQAREAPIAGMKRLVYSANGLFCIFWFWLNFHFSLKRGIKGCPQGLYPVAKKKSLCTGQLFGLVTRLSTWALVYPSNHTTSPWPVQTFELAFSCFLRNDPFLVPSNFFLPFCQKNRHFFIIWNLVN